jgi:uncharacterized membrane protein
MNGETLTIRKATFGDLTAALRLGFRDFMRAPRFGLFFGAIYTLGGLALTWFSLILDAGWMVYPLVVGFALIGPFIATGLYEVSRRLENGEPLTWPAVLLVVLAQHKRELGWMAFVSLFVFWVWMYQARTLFVVFFGSNGFATFGAFVTTVLNTPSGWWFLIIGHALGAAISLVMFALTAISIPMLLERDVDFVTAMLTSLRTILASPVVMICWGLFVSGVVFLSAIPAFAGLIISLPVLGHAAWHLYKRLVVPAN